MKKFKVFLIALCALIFSGAFGQGGFVPVYVVPDLTTNFKVNVPVGSLVYVQSTDRFYNVLVAVGRTVNMTYVLEDATRYDDATVAALGSTLTITDSLIVPVVDATNKVIIKSQILSEDNVNRLDLNNSLQVNDTLFIGSSQYLFQTTVNRIKGEGSIQATDTLAATTVSGSTRLLVGIQALTQDNINRLDANNSLQINDTLFLGSNQFLLQTNINKIKTEGSLQVVDSLFIGANQYLFQKNTNGLKSEGSVTIPDTMFLGSGQYLFQNTVNGIKANNSITAADTVFGAMLSAGLYVFVNGQTIAAPNTNKASFNNSLGVTDTLFIGSNQHFLQTTINRIKSEGSFQATDTLSATVVNPTTNLTIGTQVLTQKNTNGVTWNNSITASDTVFGNVVTSAGNLSATGITGSALPTFTIAAGTATPVLLADTINIPVSGLTTSAIIICSYAAYVAPTDTMCFVKTVKTGHFTLCGKNGIPINYWIPKK